MSELDQDLDETLANWDGKHAAPLKECYARQKTDPTLAQALLARIGSDRAATADGVSWILKARMEDGMALSANETAALVQVLPQLHSKDTVLHICQIVRYLSLPDTDAARFVDWLETYLTHKRPFLRTWSLDALVAIAKNHPKYRDQANAALVKAEADPAASVRARARNLTRV